MRVLHKKPVLTRRENSKIKINLCIYAISGWATTKSPCVAEWTVILHHSDFYIRRRRCLLSTVHGAVVCMSWTQWFGLAELVLHRVTFMPKFFTTWYSRDGPIEIPIIHSKKMTIFTSVELERLIKCLWLYKEWVGSTYKNNHPPSNLLNSFVRRFSRWDWWLCAL